MDEPLAALRRLCNETIKAINTGSGASTPGFRQINALLRACDKVFAAAPDKYLTLKEVDAGKRVYAFAKSPHCTVEDHNHIMVVLDALERVASLPAPETRSE